MRTVAPLGIASVIDLLAAEPNSPRKVGCKPRTGPTVVLIPSFQPDQTLAKVVLGIIESLSDVCARNEIVVVVVNDGSDTTISKAVYADIRHLSSVVILDHERNLGKGAALRTGFRYAQHIDASRVITADADGQHRPKDISKLYNENTAGCQLTLGVRNFQQKGVPLRSRAGNLCTKFIFHALHGVNLKDTQTGLRVVPKALYSKFLALSSSRFEYELECLILAAKSGPIKQLSIDTVYEKGNPSSHFRPILDSMRIYAVLLRSILATTLTSGIDLALFGISIAMGTPTVVAIAISRAVALGLYYVLAREFVFRSTGTPILEVSKLILLVAANSLFLSAFVDASSAYTGASKLSAYLVGALGLYALSFFAQRFYIFRTQSG